MGRIFLNYRRADSQWAVGRVYDWLVNNLGQEEVFLDVKGIPKTVDFRDYLATELNRCDVLVVAICNQWVQILNDRACSGATDHVRFEIEKHGFRWTPSKGAWQRKATGLPLIRC